MKLRNQVFVLLCVFYISCEEEAIDTKQVDYYDQLQTQLIMASSGETVLLPKGFITLNRGLMDYLM